MTDFWEEKENAAKDALRVEVQGGVSVAPVINAYGARVSAARPNDTAAYQAKDVIGAATGSTAALTFPVGPAGGGEVLITSAALEIDVAAVPSGMTSFTLHLYSVTPQSALGDNAPWDLPSGDRANYLGSISLGAPVDVGSTLYVQSEAINKQLTLVGANLYAYLVTDGAFTPAAQTVKAVTLHTVRM